MNNNQWEEVSSRARVVLNYGVVKKEWLESSLFLDSSRDICLATQELGLGDEESGCEVVIF
jgi:hypothetical protein